MSIIELSNYDERFKNYRKMILYLLNVSLKNNCLRIGDNNNYLLGNNINLYEKIGSESKYGNIYKCKNTNPIFEGIPKFTIKVQLFNKVIRNEIRIALKISNYGIKYKIPNLPIIYKIIKCNDLSFANNFLKIKEKSKSKSKIRSYVMILNELAKGDLYYFLKNTMMSDELWRNTYEQIFISLLILHSKGILHNDAHGGNFLYHKIKKGGCFHYNINEVDYYIKNLGYIWTSWDYGLIKKLETYGSYVYDYMDILLVMRKNDITKMTPRYKNHKYYKKYQWGYLNKNVNVSNDIQKLQIKLYEKLGESNKNNHIYQIKRLKLTEDLFLKYFLKKGLLFMDKPDGKIISSVKIRIPVYKEGRDLRLPKNKENYL